MIPKDLTGQELIKNPKGQKENDYERYYQQFYRNVL